MLKRFRQHIRLIAFFVVLASGIMAQPGPPSLRCTSVGANGNVTLTWVIPPDPSGQFFSYEIYNSVFSAGPFSLVATVNTYAQNTYLHAINGGTLQSQYYYIRTVSNGGAVTSASSDTIRSIFLNIGNAANGRPPLSWNRVHTPVLPTGTPTFTLSRQSPPGAWSTFYVGSDLSRVDTISICRVFYNYKIETPDAQGCISLSNINGGLFEDHTPAVGWQVPALDSVSVNPDGSVTIGWEPSGAPDVVRYVVYLAGSTNQPIDTVNGRFNTVYTYTNSNAASGPETYVIAAIDSCGNISQLTNAGQKTIFLSLKYDFCARTAQLSWTNYGNLPKGISRYQVYCSINGATPTIIGTTSSNAFTQSKLNPGDNYCYYVRVINNGDDITATSNVKCILATAPQGPAYVYMRSASVTPDQQVAITYVIDNSRAYKGATVFRSPDGITFSQIHYQASGSGTMNVFVDKDVKPHDKTYYYKLQISDSCGNPGPFSNVSKTSVLKVSNDHENIYYNTLTWEDYAGFSGGVQSYNIYRAVNGVFSPVAVDNVPYGTRIYVDNVESFSSEQGKFSYYVEAVEGPGNIYSYKDSARSNVADAYVEVNVFVPNAFCPKGVNKIWMPVAQFVEKTDYKVSVFDRWGTRVFQTSSDTEGWDGSGTTDEVFVYLVEYKNARGEFIQLKGHLTLVR